MAIKGEIIFTRYRTLIVLTLAQSFGQTATPIFVLLGGIVGAQLAPSVDWATLPVASLIVGIAAATMPASMLMAKIGRRAGFLLASLVSVAAALMAAWAVYQGAFILFCIAAFLIGGYSAFVHQFRFAVAESVPTDLIPKSLSVLMLAGIVAAVLGPEVARRFSAYGAVPEFVGSFLGLAVLLLVSTLILLLFYRNSQVVISEAEDDARDLADIFKQPALILAVASAAVGYTVMSLIMTATPVSMHEMDHHSLDDTTWVVQSHILAMYIPSLFSGLLISWLGVMRIIQAGFVLMLVCVAVGWGQPELMHYWGSMVLLGVGWNFLFLGGTTLLTQTYRTSERYKVQAVNDFLVFGLQAGGSLGAGVILAALGWNGVMWFTLPWLVLLLPVMIVVGRRRTQI